MNSKNRKDDEDVSKEIELKKVNEEIKKAENELKKLYSRINKLIKTTK